MLSSAALEIAKPVDPHWIAQSKQEALRSQRLLISTVGLTAILLPLALVGLDAGFGPQCVRDSLSHYYFGRQTGDVFVMTLAFIGSMLLAYRGETRRISRLAGLAGIAAILVGLFPTVGSGCVDGSFDARLYAAFSTDAVVVDAGAFVLFPGVDWLHYGAAAVLFGLMFYFCQFVFPLVGKDDVDPVTGDLLPIKRLRNLIYRLCAAFIALPIIVLLYDFIIGVPGARDFNLTLIAEWVALWALGLAWLVKGRLFNLQGMGA